MTQEMKAVTDQNDRVFRSIAGKIGIAMILNMVFLNVFTIVAEIFVVMIESLLIDVAAYILREILYMIAYLAGFLLPAWILHLWLRSSGHAQPIIRGKKLPSKVIPMVISAIALNFTASYFNSLIVSSFFPPQMMDASFMEMEAQELHEIIMLFLSIAVVPAVCEEILFRGVILNNLLPYGRTVAIIGSAFLFGLMHGNPLQFLYTSALGVVIALIYVRTKNLWCCMLIHFVNNGIAVLQEVLFGCLSPDDAARWNGVLDFAVMAGGAVALFLMLLTYKKKRKPEDEGSFGVVFEPSLDYECYPTTRAKKLKNFFHPSMIVFTVLSGLSMLVILFAIFLEGVLPS